MKNWTIGKRIIACSMFLCIVIAAIIVTSILSVIKIKGISQSITENSIPCLIETGKLNAFQSETMIRVYRALNAATSEERRALKAEMDDYGTKVDKSLKAYEEGISTEENRRNFEAFKEKRADNTRMRNQFLTLLETNREEARKVLDGELSKAYEDY